MTLTEPHRQKLIFELKETTEQIELNKKIFERAEEEIKPLFEIELFLLQKRLEIIENSLIFNEIDF